MGWLLVRPSRGGTARGIAYKLGGNLILGRQLVTDDLHHRKAADVIGRGITFASHLVPDRNDNLNADEGIEVGADMFAVGNAWPARYPIPGHELMISRIIRIDVTV